MLKVLVWTILFIAEMLLLWFKSIFNSFSLAILNSTKEQVFSKALILNINFEEKEYYLKKCYFFNSKIEFSKLESRKYYLYERKFNLDNTCKH